MDVGEQFWPAQGEQVVVAFQVATAAAVGTVLMAFGEVLFVRRSRASCPPRHLYILYIVPFGEALAAIAGFVELVALDHGAHGTIEHHDALGQQRQQFFYALGLAPGQRSEARRVGTEGLSKCRSPGVAYT